ncbi:MAG: hypothetical protein RTU92_12260 [Candidatus Thorarchaeota archaeon]
MYKDCLSSIDIARKLGVSSEKIETVLNILKQALQNETHEALLERIVGMVHGSNSQRIEAKALREQLFGNNCKICNKDCSNGILAIHRKDGAPHKSKKLWHPDELRKLNPEEWAPLCPRCHHMVTWLSEFLEMSWNQIIKEVENKQSNLVEQPPTLPNTREFRRKIPTDVTIEEKRILRFDIFGHECDTCKRHKDDFKLILHRKDGEKHHRNSTWTVDFIKTANPDDWVMLCIRCHNAVHRTMKELGLSWERIRKLRDKR